jgi:hypothetical protein
VKIATYNVTGIKGRLAVVLRRLELTVVSELLGRGPIGQGHVLQHGSGYDSGVLPMFK